MVWARLASQPIARLAVVEIGAQQQLLIGGF